jgi:hypothetical protein
VRKNKRRLPVNLDQRRHSSNGSLKNGRVRLSGYVTPQLKASWIKEKKRSEQVDGAAMDNGEIFTRIIENGVHFDKRSLAGYSKTYKRAKA